MYLSDLGAALTGGETEELMQVIEEQVRQIQTQILKQIIFREIHKYR